MLMNFRYHKIRAYGDPKYLRRFVFRLWLFGKVCLSVGRFVRSILVGLNYLHVYTASQLEQDVQKVKFKHNKFFKLFINYNE